MAGSPDTEPLQHLGLLPTFRSALACKDITTNNSETLRQIILKATELAELEVATIQQREGRWVLADLEGKGRRIRTVAIPIWVKHGIDAWTAAAGIDKGRLLRSISKSGKVNRDTLSDWAVWSVVEQSSKQIGIEHFGAHDLRRTCARLCRKNGGDLEQIKFLLGHSSIQTTERYLGSEQDIEIAVNDNLGL
jgi:integrase